MFVILSSICFTITQSQASIFGPPLREAANINLSTANRREGGKRETKTFNACVRFLGAFGGALNSVHSPPFSDSSFLPFIYELERIGINIAILNSCCGCAALRCIGLRLCTLAWFSSIVGSKIFIFFRGTFLLFRIFKGARLFFFCFHCPLKIESDLVTTRICGKEDLIYIYVVGRSLDLKMELLEKKWRKCFILQRGKGCPDNGYSSFFMGFNEYTAKSIRLKDTRKQFDKWLSADNKVTY